MQHKVLNCLLAVFCVQIAMDRSSGGQSQRWFEGKTDQQSQSAVRVGPSAVNVISITRRPEGGIVNVEVRRQEGSGVDQTGSFGSQESSPHSVVFAKTPPLPVDTRFRGFGGIALHSTDTGRLHRALADHVRALHGQSLFDRFNEPFIDTNVAHSSSSLSSGRRIHTIPIRVEGRHRPASCPPATPQHQRVYEIPVNVLSSSKDKTPTAGVPSDQTTQFDAAKSVHGTQRFPRLQSQFGSSDDTERKLASLMSQLETEMNSSSPVKKQLSEISLTPVAVSAAKSPPPYHGPHITEFHSRAPQLSEGVASPGKPAAGFVSIADAHSPSPVQSPGFSEPGTPVRTAAVDSELHSQVERFGELCVAVMDVCLCL